MARCQEHPLAHLSPELADVFDFFIALTICNTVVVTSPNQPRQKASSEVSPLDDVLDLQWGPLLSVFLRALLFPFHLSGVRGCRMTLTDRGVR